MRLSPSPIPQGALQARTKMIPLAAHAAEIQALEANLIALAEMYGEACAKPAGYRETAIHYAEQLAIRQCDASAAALDQRDTAEARADRLAAENAVLRAALNPFAEAADELHDDAADRDHLWESPAAMSLTAGNLRAARAALPEAITPKETSDVED